MSPGGCSDQACLCTDSGTAATVEITKRVPLALNGNWFSRQPEMRAQTSTAGSGLQAG
jgi:hypothetical protein